MDTNRNVDVISPHADEHPAEAEILSGDAEHEPGSTEEPGEVGENTRDFQHGSWGYDVGDVDRRNSEYGGDDRDDMNPTSP